MHHVQRRCGGGVGQNNRATVHLWSRSILRKIGNSCEGFLAMDEDTTFMVDLRWARIRVLWDGKTYP